ncbi:MAG: hypothetical protein ACI9MR_003749, partial [Myxococcota bacterium]
FGRVLLPPVGSTSKEERGPNQGGQPTLAGRANV